MGVADMMADYLACRATRVPIADQTDGERGGRFLIHSCGRTDDGEPDPKAAARAALSCGQIGAAVAIADAVIPFPFDDNTTRPGPVAGEIAP